MCAERAVFGNNKPKWDGGCNETEASDGSVAVCWTNVWEFVHIHGTPRGMSTQKQKPAPQRPGPAKRTSGAFQAAASKKARGGCADLRCPRKKKWNAEFQVSTLKVFLHTFVAAQLSSHHTSHRCSEANLSDNAGQMTSSTSSCHALKLLKAKAWQQRC